MNRRIIALRGRGEIGKSTTILLLPNLLIAMGWTLVSHVLHGNEIDITDVYRNENGDLLGVASAGDNFDEVNGALTILFGAGCPVVICACRTKDVGRRGRPARGTNFAMRQFTNNIRFVNKTIIEADDDVRRARANGDDANTLLTFI